MSEASAADALSAAGSAVPAGALHVETGGALDGETLVLLHGGTAGGVMWAPQREALDDFHLLVPDLPGYGGSREVPWRTMVETADRVADVIRDQAHLDADGRPGAHLVGISLGALVGAVLVARHPELVRSAMLSGTPLRGLGPFMAQVARAQFWLWRRAAFWRARAQRDRVPSEAMADVIASGIGIDVPSGRRVVEQVNTGIGELLPAVAASPARVLGIAGERESRRVRAALGVYAAGPNSVVRLAPGGHHLWNYENPELFEQTVRRWALEATAHPELRPVPASTLRPPRRGRSARP